MGIYEDLGQGRFATSQESKSVGLYVQGGIHTGFDGQVPLYNHTQSPMILVAGSGGRKGAGFVVWNVVNYPGSMLVNDDKVELARIAMAHQHKLGIEMRCYNPYDKHDVPDHGCNPLDILDTKDPMYHSYVQRFSENFVQLSGAPSGKFFEEFGQRWFSGGMKFDLGMRGHTSLSHLYDLFNTLQYDTDAFKKITQAMMRSSLRDVAIVGAEMVAAAKADSKRFGDIMAEINNPFKVFSQPAIYKTAKGGAGSLRDLYTAKRPQKHFMCLPPEAQLYKKFMVVSASLYKEANPKGRRAIFLFDEIGQMGNFPEYLRLQTYGQGVGIKTIGIWQGRNQMQRSFGPEGAGVVISSASERMFMSIRDVDDAKVISDMLGNYTQEFVDPTRQVSAEAGKRRAAQAILEGHDPIAAAIDAQHYENLYHVKSRSPREVMKPDELLSMPSDKMIIFNSGLKGCPRPILADVYNYWERPEMAGKYLNNPYYPPENKVQVQIGKRKRNLKIKKGRPPFFKRNWPQFDNGYWYVKGYR